MNRLTTEAFTAIWNAHRTVREAADAAGMSASGALVRARRLGLDRKTNPKGPRPNMEDVASVRTMRAQGMTYRQIGSAMGRPASFAHKHGRNA